MRRVWSALAHFGNLYRVGVVWRSLLRQPLLAFIFGLNTNAKLKFTEKSVTLSVISSLDE